VVNGRFDLDIALAILADTSAGAACPANSSTVPERRRSWQSGHALDHEVQEPLVQWVANVRCPLWAQDNFAPGVPLFQDAIGLADLVEREHLGDRNV
jgi:hypothetical protein